MPAALLATVASDSDPDREYEIRRGGDGVVYCTCPAWKFQKGVSPRFRSCKHIRRRPDLLVKSAAVESVTVSVTWRR